MNYSNKDCLNNTISDLAPVSFKGKISGNNCATFNGNSDGIFLSQSSIIDTDNCVISFDFRMPTSISHNIVFFQGIVKNDNDFSSGTAYGWHLYMVSGTKVINLCRPDGKKQNLGTHTELLDNKPHRFELTINGPSSPASLKIDNVSVITGSDSGSFKDTGRSYIGVGNESGSTLMDYYVGSIWNFKISDQNDNLIHWYPLAEGSNTIAYDAVGNVNGGIVSNSISTFWGTKQDVFAYNAINGYKVDSNQATALSTAKVPSDKDICIYKSNFISSVDGWEHGAGTVWTGPSVSNNKLVIYRWDSDAILLNNATLGSFNSVLTNAYHIKFKVKNISTTEGTFNSKINQIVITIGYPNRTENSIAYKLFSDLQLESGSEYIVDTDIPLSNKNNTQNVIDLAFVGYQKAPDANNQLGVEISDIELTQTNNTTTYEPVTNGIPPCESNLDFTQGISNVAELKNVSFATTLKPYPKIWYKSNFSSSIDGWSNRGGITGFSYANNKLIQTQTATSLRFNHLVPSGFMLSNKFYNGTWHFKGTITNNSENTLASNTTLAITIGSYTASSGLANKLGIDSLVNLIPGGTVSLDLDIPSLPTTGSSFDPNLLIQLFFGNLSSSSQENSIALSDIEISYTPTSDTYAPIHTKITENGSIQNPLIYKKAQTGINLDRIKNKLKHS